MMLIGSGRKIFHFIEPININTYQPSSTFINPINLINPINPYFGTLIL